MYFATSTLSLRSLIEVSFLQSRCSYLAFQTAEASLYGSDAILLIAAILDVAQMRDFCQMAEELNMDVLVEVHNEAELESALDAGSRLIGINNRNLNDFTVDLNTTFRLQRLIPADIPVVSESGISTKDDMVRLREAGVAAALIGESLMRSVDQGQLLKEFISA